MSRQSGIAYTPLLRRLDTQHQVGASRVQRKKQLHDAYYCSTLARVAAEHIVLVDDVSTTGSTLESTVRTLVQAGASSVRAVVFAQA